jgi:hypothetical protein
MDDRDRHLLIMQLLATSAQIDATLAVLGYENGESDECEHPPEKVVNLAGFGEPERYHCNLCGEDLDHDPNDKSLVPSEE